MIYPIFEDFPIAMQSISVAKVKGSEREPRTSTGDAINEASFDFVARLYSTAWW